ncbi:hypothetical protein F5Y06DRAFT_108908 [Hypoxylon sp. FL0890]|nr:hypothetical protein F5Y06DRAFT_108908 [Hypoxylon sp. FL0890]
MDEYVSRTTFLIFRLRSRIRDLALLQCHINDDVKLFRNGGYEARARFNITRQKYLSLLELSVGQLREVMGSETDSPVNDPEAEEIMKRVKPVSKRHLQRLVLEGQITEIDMQCILAGGYPSVDAFFEDLDANVGSFGVVSEESSSSGAPNATLNNNLPGTYDDSGFLVGDKKDDETRTDEAATDNHQAESQTSNSVTPPAVLLPPSEPFNWADEVEEELEAMEPLDLDQPSTSSPASPGEPMEVVTEVSLSDTDDDSSDFDMDADRQKSSISSLEPPLNAEPENEEQVDIEMIENIAEASSSSILDLSNQIEEPKPATIQTYLKSSRPTDDDEILDILWLEDHDMWFWQYEIIFAAKLLARQFKEEFKGARDAYKVDPFADVD